VTQREFYNKVTNSKEDILEKFLKILNKYKIPYAVIGGVACNAYCEPVVTQDVDCVVPLGKIDELVEILKKEGFKVKKFPYSINITQESSDIRIQIQLDKDYEPFLKRTISKEVMGYKMQVARKEDVLISKIKAYKDKTRRLSKRTKDLSDIQRLIENYPELLKLVPDDIKDDVIGKKE